MSENFFAANRSNWESRVPIHLADATGFYRVEEIVAGGDSLTPLEAAEIGDVSGLRVLHLQCHFGLDTLSLARRGAEITGLDFSPSAISAARALFARAGVSGAFVEGNVYDAPKLLQGGFDLVFTSWGAIYWLPDVRSWAAAIAALLAPGGSLYFADSHPNMQTLDEVEGRLAVVYDWRTPADAPLRFEDPTTYTGDEMPPESRVSYGWHHPLGDILAALSEAGLKLEMLHEHEAVPWKPFPTLMIQGEDGLWRLRDGLPRIPLALSLRARK